MSEQTSTPKLTGQFSKALVYAELKHHNQVRKGGDIPYVGHLLSVAGPGDQRRRLRSTGHRCAVARRSRGSGRTRDARRDPGQLRRRRRAHRRRVQRHRREAEATVARSQAQATSITLPRSATTRCWSQSPTSSTTRGRCCATTTTHGPSLWERFNRKNPQDHLWYYGELLKAYRKPRLHQLDGRRARPRGRRVEAPGRRRRQSRPGLTLGRWWGIEHFDVIALPLVAHAGDGRGGACVALTRRRVIENHRVVRAARRVERRESIRFRRAGPDVGAAMEHERLHRRARRPALNHHEDGREVVAGVVVTADRRGLPSPAGGRFGWQFRKCRLQSGCRRRARMSVKVAQRASERLVVQRPVMERPMAAR